MPKAPVAGRPQSTLIGSLNPGARDPVVARLRIAGLCVGPIAGRPEIVIAGSRRLVVFGQRRRRIVSGIRGLLSVAGIIRSLISGLGVASPIRRWRTLLGNVGRRRALLRARLLRRLKARVRRCGGHVGRCGIGNLVLRGGHPVLIRFAPGGKENGREGKQRQGSKSAERVHFDLQ